MILRLVATFYKSNSSPQKYNLIIFLVGLVGMDFPRLLNTKIRNEYDILR
jgi:hypothetical protein